MSEIPERIEREMFEIRSRMAPDVQDLRAHTDPQTMGKQVGEKVKNRVRTTLTAFLNSLLASARHQAELAREAGEKRDPAPLTDAVKSDPRPLIILAVALALTLMVGRKLTNSRE